MKAHEVGDPRRQGSGRRRSWRLWAGTLATVALIGLLVTACGTTPPPASPATATSRVQAALTYAKCMRAHGVPDFPDPDNNGNFHLQNNQQPARSKVSGSNSATPQETAANRVCNHLLDVGTQLNATQRANALNQLVKYAQCMRAHGVVNFPDPHLTSGGIGVPGGIGFNLSGIDLNSPRTRAANRACQSIAAHAKG